MHTCYLCETITQNGESSANLCESCIDTYPYLSYGIIAETDTVWTEKVTPKLGDGIGWYSVVGFNNTNEDLPDGEDPQDTVNLLKNKIESFGVERTLTYLRIQAIVGEFIQDLQYTSRDKAGLTAQLNRFGFGLAMSIEDDDDSNLHNPRSNEIITQFPEEYRDIIYLLKQCSDIFSSRKFIKSNTDLDLEEKNRHKLDVIRAVQYRELIVGRITFHRQLLEAMERQYTPFQTELYEYCGIDVISSLNWAKKIVDDQEAQLEELLQVIIEYRNSCLRVLGGYYRAKKVNQSVLSVDEYITTDEYQRLRKRELVNLNDLIQATRSRVWVSHSEIQKKVNAVNNSQFDSFLDSIQTTVGGPTFNSPYQHNPIDETPLANIGEYTFISPLPRLCYALSQRYYYMLRQYQNNFNENFDNKWGDIMEVWAVNRISQILSGEKFVHSVEYSNSNNNGEIDILIRVGNSVIVCEVKSKRLTVKSRSGSLEHIYADTVNSDTGIGKALDQVTQAIDALKNINSDTTIETEVPFSLDSSEIDHYEPVIITSTHYDQLATKELPKILTEYSNDELPYVCSVYDLDAFAEVLSSEEFADYINARREELLKRRAHGAGDEIDFLEAYKAGVLRESAYQLPSKESTDEVDLEITRGISSIDAGVYNKVASRYGNAIKYDQKSF